jgi:hypothetical protein
MKRKNRLLDTHRAALVGFFMAEQAGADLRINKPLGVILGRLWYYDS